MSAILVWMLLVTSSLPDTKPVLVLYKTQAECEFRQKDVLGAAARDKEFKGIKITAVCTEVRAMLQKEGKGV